MHVPPPKKVKNYTQNHIKKQCDYTTHANLEKKCKLNLNQTQPSKGFVLNWTITGKNSKANCTLII